MFDFNDAEKQREGGLIPDGTVVPVHLTVRPGGAGEGAWLKRNRDGNCLMLDCEFTVFEGEFAPRKFWSLLTVEGETEGQKKGADITRSRIRAMLESARGINPADTGEAAIAQRRIGGFQDLDGLRFWAVVGLEEGRDGYKDKNVLKAVVTPDRKGWTKLEQQGGGRSTPSASRPAGGPVAAPAASTGSARPSWAGSTRQAPPAAAARQSFPEDKIPF